MGDKIGWRHRLERIPGYSHQFELNPKSTALLVVDMQNTYANTNVGFWTMLREDYPDVEANIYERVTKVLVPNNIRLIDFFRRNLMRIVFLANGIELPGCEDYLPLRRQRAKEGHFIPRVGTFEYQIIDELRPREDELIITKRSTGAFNSTAIDQQLHNMGIDGLVITGFATHACVGLTASDAADRGYKCILVDDACATFNEEMHDAFLLVFAQLHGKVLSTGEVITYLEKQLAGVKHILDSTY